jgi:regulator of RNase E activity RraA
VAQLTAPEIDALRRLDTCAIANAIETFERRLRNEGSTDGSIRCVYDRMPTVVGYATTARVRTAAPPAVGHQYQDRTDWWTHILTTPAPRIVVVEDADDPAGGGAFVGEVHAHILKALGCVAYVTNGAVRDLPAIRETGFQLFAGRVSVSHSFAHLIEFGSTVTVGGLSIRPGDLLCGDVHGLVAVPEAIARDVAPAAEALLLQERAIVALCNSPEFSLDKLRALVRQVA